MIRYTLPPITPREDITVLICHYNTLDLIKLCVSSLITHYPDLKIMVLDDNSTDYSRTWLKSRERLIPNLTVVDWDGVHSHGVKMDYALKNLITTPWVWVLDSDTIIRYREELPLKGYCAGTIMMQSRTQYACAPATGVDSMKYCHPSNMLINRLQYCSMRPFTDHGAPCVYNMLDAQELEMTQWGEDHVLHLCGGSWTTPRTVWHHDHGVQVRPLVTVINGRCSHPDAECVYMDEAHVQYIVMWENEPRHSGTLFEHRFRPQGWYVCFGDVSEEEVEALARGEESDRFVWRQTWQMGC